MPPKSSGEIPRGGIEGDAFWFQVRAVGGQTGGREAGEFALIAGQELRAVDSVDSVEE